MHTFVLLFCFLKLFWAPAKPPLLLPHLSLPGPASCPPSKGLLPARTLVSLLDCPCSPFGWPGNSKCSMRSSRQWKRRWGQLSDKDNGCCSIWKRKQKPLSSESWSSLWDVQDVHPPSACLIGHALCNPGLGTSPFPVTCRLSWTYLCRNFWD